MAKAKVYRNVMREVGATPEIHVTDLPLASEWLTSYRYRGRFGWVMIGANNHSEALREASRSISERVTTDKLEVWNGDRYQPVEA